MTIRSVFIPAAIAIAATALLAGPVSAADTESRQIRVTGVGEVFAAPDMAIVSLGVVTEAETASDALARNSETIAEVIAALKNEGIAARDLQTSGLSVQPVYSRHDGTNPRSSEPPKIVGYSARNTVTARIRDLDRTGLLLDRMVSLGSNTLNGITFSIADPKPLEAEARKAAVADARSKAQLYAEAAGLKLGEIVLISEPETRAPKPMAMHSRAASAEMAVPVEAGELTVSASIDIVWQLDD